MSIHSALRCQKKKNTRSSNSFTCFKPGSPNSVLEKDILRWMEMSIWGVNHVRTRRRVARNKSVKITSPAQAAWACDYPGKKLSLRLSLCNQTYWSLLSFPLKLLMFSLSNSCTKYNTSAGVCIVVFLATWKRGHFIAHSWKCDFRLQRSWTSSR